MTVLSRLAGPLLKLPPPETRDISVERDVAANMADGVALLADRWFPTRSSEDLPTLLIRTPYGRRVMGPLGRLFAERGYQTVIQSCRGTFGSGGAWEPLRHERSDGHATLQWVAGQPWFDGRLVMWGASYLGMTQWAVAADPPEFLKAMALDVTAANSRDAFVYPGGSFALEMALSWAYQLKYQELGFRTVLRTQAHSAKVVARAAGILPLGRADVEAVGESVPAYQDWLEHSEPGDEWWDVTDYSRQLSRVPPASFVGGWYDIFLAAQVADYEAVRRAGRSARLTIGPWTHSSPGLVGASVRDGLSWFDAQLGKGQGAERAPVRVFVMGRNRWEEFSLWPPAAEERRWYLGPEQTLVPEPGPAREPDRFHFNPHDPTPAIGGASLNLGTSGPKDQRERESRRDVLTYTSPVLKEDLAVVGPLRASLFVRSSLAHTDFFVRLCDVDRKGKSTNVSDGILRLTPGSANADEDGVLELEIAMWPTANSFRVGHRIRLQVSSGAHPLYARNSGTGEPLATGSFLRSADQEVFGGGSRSSSIGLPVVSLFG